jgi:hypothetical protein
MKNNKFCQKLNVINCIGVFILICLLSSIGCAAIGGLGQGFTTPCPECDDTTNRNNLINEWPCADCSPLGGFDKDLPGWHCVTCDNRGVFTVYRACIHRGGETRQLICTACGGINCTVDHTIRVTPTEQVVRTTPEPIISTEPISPTFRIDQVTTWTVRRGDTLMAISRASYNGDASRWRDIYEANRGQINNPHRIFPGQVLIIPR